MQVLSPSYVDATASAAAAAAARAAGITEKLPAAAASLRVSEVGGFRLTAWHTLLFTIQLGAGHLEGERAAAAAMQTLVNALGWYCFASTAELFAVSAAAVNSMLPSALFVVSRCCVRWMTNRLRLRPLQVVGLQSSSRWMTAMELVHPSSPQINQENPVPPQHSTPNIKTLP